MAAPQKLQHSIVGLGNPLLDISAKVHDAFLTKYGITVDNAILAEEKHLPMYDELTKEFQAEFIAGGATQNSIRVAQWMLKKQCANATSFFGCVGNDEFGKVLKDCAIKDGVNAHYMVHEKVATGTCAVCVNEAGERSLVANLSAANEFELAHLDDAASKTIVENGKLYYSAGFHLTVCPQAIMKLAEHAAFSNKIFMLNLSAPFIVQFFKDALMPAVHHADFVFGNENEALEFGKAHGWGEDLAVIALRLSQLPKASGARCRTVVFTQGAKPTITVHNGTLRLFDVPALDQKEIVDTNGAGDAFVGGFIAQMALEQPIEKCVDAGHWAAQVVIRRSGCTFPDTCDYK
ncbi:adenosine kinase [Saprolegnia diclina VS20]|uniref:Adenosine kinase n=1 Tax=Saprolegnia diclina (strain VS20) TaxID=1156394 RepID=T0Q2D1_SAPDV|nr:adenosine kinase [Saprolegnia diclina VS20]EQC28726.1 adenosine kinase [Saprolegnia diclina VS20]|eukprot:XP_008617918.1 adenosine kinase [Saprolegnia diclina VS20]